jgi:hypothetical protein
MSLNRKCSIPLVTDMMKSFIYKKLNTLNEYKEEGIPFNEVDITKKILSLIPKSFNAESDFILYLKNVSHFSNLLEMMEEFQSFIRDKFGKSLLIDFATSKELKIWKIKSKGKLEETKIKKEQKDLFLKDKLTFATQSKQKEDWNKFEKCKRCNKKHTGDAKKCKSVMSLTDDGKRYFLGINTELSSQKQTELKTKFRKYLEKHKPEDEVPLLNTPPATVN